MKNNKRYNVDSQKLIEISMAQQKERLLGLKRTPSRKGVFAESPIGEACCGRMAQYAKDLAEYAGVQIGTNGQTPYYYKIQNNGDKTQLIIGRR